jgi:hypothetical protein
MDVAEFQQSIDVNDDAPNPGNKTKTWRNAFWSGVVLQVILVMVSVFSLHQHPAIGVVSLVALAIFWLAVLAQWYRLGSRDRVNAMDLHLLRWGYFWVYCAVTVVYRLLPG